MDSDMKKITDNLLHDVYRSQEICKKFKEQKQFEERVTQNVLRHIKQQSILYKLKKNLNKLLNSIKQSLKFLFSKPAPAFITILCLLIGVIGILISKGVI